MTSVKAIRDAAALRLWMHSVRFTDFRTFVRQLDDPERTQWLTLQSILASNGETAFGKRYGFDSIRSAEEFRKRIPIHEYEDLRDYIERQIEQGSAELNSSRPQLYAQTSGTTGKPKLIPLCQGTMRSFARMQRINSYLRDQAAPGIFSGRLLALVSPMVEGAVADGTPFGSMSGVVGHTLPAIVGGKSLLPQRHDFASLDYESRYRLIAAIALCCENITCLASANPSTFLRLSEIINEHYSELLRYISTGDPETLGVAVDGPLRALLRQLCSPGPARLAELEAIKPRKGTVVFSDLWPSLRALVTWTSGNCSFLLPKLRRQLAPDVKIIEMGYLASEFWGTIVVDPENNAGVPTIADTFFEFIEPELWESGECNTKLLSELEVGRRYYILATTRGGLYRYFINDLIEVTGRYRNTPTLSFLQKGKGVTTLTGEKLYEGQVTEAVRRACAEVNREVDAFIMLADRNSFSYTLYFESAAQVESVAFAAALNRALSDLNVEYASKLSSGRLPAAVVRPVKMGTFELVKRAAVSAGQREGQFKLVKLQYSDDCRFNFDEHLV